MVFCYSSPWKLIKKSNQEADTLCFLSYKAHKHTFAWLPFRSSWSCVGALGRQREGMSLKDTQSSHDCHVCVVFSVTSPM